MGMIRFIISVILLSLITAPAHARWRMAESDHFVIYADDRAQDLARFGDMLERYHSAMELLTGHETGTPSPSNRVTIYAVGSKAQIQRLSGSRDIAGFYSPRAGGSSAFVQDIRLNTRESDFSLTVLLHEYAHHFTMTSSPQAMPRWLSEGGAEFFASADFPRNGDVEIGRPAYHRAGAILYELEVHVRDLIGYDQSEDRPDIGAFYGRSWLLYHLLAFTPERRGQLQHYVAALAEGESSLAAAELAFGDLDALNDDVNAYAKKRRMSFHKLRAEGLQPGPVTIHELSDGMDAVLPLMIRSKRGVDEEEARELLPQIREIAAEYPEDAGVLAALAEAAFDAGEDAEAIAAADRALALDPQKVNAYIQKGYALFRMADEADDPEAAYVTAMEPFAELNQLENDHPLPLISYFRAFVRSGQRPNQMAQDALERAGQLAPFDHGLKMTIAQMQAAEGKLELARYNLRPLAANPHGGELSRRAQAYIASLEQVEDGVPVILGMTAIQFDPAEDIAPVEIR